MSGPVAWPAGEMALPAFSAAWFRGDDDSPSAVREALLRAFFQALFSVDEYCASARMLQCRERACHAGAAGFVDEIAQLLHGARDVSLGVEAGGPTSAPSIARLAPSSGR